MSEVRASLEATVPWLALLLASATAGAQPTVRVRAEARIELRATHADGVVTVEGTLVDDLGEPMARRSVVVGIHRPDGRTLHTSRETTDAEGAFAIQMAGAATRYALTASYGGDDFHPRLSVERQADLSRTPTRLRLDVGTGRFDLDADSHVVVAEAAGEPALPVAIRDELGRELAAGATDAGGRFEARIASSALGEPGDGRLVAHTRGDARRAEARVEAPIVRFRRATLTLTPSRTTIGPEGELRLEGRLATSTGALANEAIGLFAGDEHVDTALTDAEGRYAVDVSAATLGTGVTRLEARFESDGPGTPAAFSGPVAIEVRGGARSVWAWLALPFAISLLLLGWFRSRAPPSEVPAPPEPEPVGVIVASPARRGPAHRRVTGRLEDLRGRPLRGRVRATDGQREAVTRCDAEGCFELELFDGRWSLSFDAPRHAAVESTVEIPHRGSHVGLRVRLESWRERALSILRDRFAAREGTERWARTTVHSLTDDRELGPIAAEVEVSYYGPLEPDGQRIDELRGAPAPGSGGQSTSRR